MDCIRFKYFHNGYSTKQTWVDRSQKALCKKLELKQPLWQQILVATKTSKQISKLNINTYNERRFQKSFKQIETILEDQIPNDRFNEIDIVLDKIPEFHHHIEIKPIVATSE